MIGWSSVSLGFHGYFHWKVTHKTGWKFESGVFSILSQVPGISNTHSFDFGVSFLQNRWLEMSRYGCFFVPFFGRCFPTSKRVKADFDRMVCERIPKAIQWLMGASLGFVFLYGQKMLKKEDYTRNLCRIFRILHFWRVNGHMSQLVWGWWRGFFRPMSHWRHETLPQGWISTSKDYEIPWDSYIIPLIIPKSALRQLCSDQNTWVFAVCNRLCTVYDCSTQWYRDYHDHRSRRPFVNDVSLEPVTKV